MTDEIPGIPLISEHFVTATEQQIRELRGRVGDEESQAAASRLEAMLTEAKSAANYTGPAPDSRSPGQKLVDRQFGVEPRRPHEYTFAMPPNSFEPDGEVTASAITEGVAELASAMSLPVAVAKAMADDIMRNGDADPAEVKSTLERMGRDVQQTFADAKYALDKVPDNEVRAEDLPIWSLTQMAIWGAHLRRHAQSRPK